MSWLSKALDTAKDVVHKVDPVAKVTDKALSYAYDKVKNFSDLEKSKLSDVWSQLKSHPQRILYGSFDPLSTKMWNKITGTNYDPIINQLGGPTEQNYDNARKRGVKGVAGSQTMHDVIGTIAGIAGGNGLSGVAGKGLAALGSKVGTAGAADLGTEGASELGTEGATQAVGDLAGSAPLDEVVVTGSNAAPGALSQAAGQLASQGAASAADHVVDDPGHATPPHDDKSAIGKIGDYVGDSKNWGTIVKGAGALNSIIKGVTGGGGTSGPPQLPGNMTSHAGPSDYSRSLNPYGDDYYTYGSRAMHDWFTQGGDKSANPASQVPVDDQVHGGVPLGYAVGGQLNFHPYVAARVAPLRSLHRRNLASGSAVRGPGTGRSDEIPARLSDGEYVFDAETTALLGDGSSEAGAQKLDQMREAIRKHKGQALSKGKFSPNAKSPLQYLKGSKSR